MNKKQTSQKGMSAGEKIAIGAGVVGASVAAYLLFGPEGKKNRKIVKGWAVKMKGEIMEKVESIKDLTEPVYENIVDQIQSKYEKLKNIDKKEVLAVAAEMRKHWKAVSKTAKPKKKAKTKSKSKAK